MTEGISKIFCLTGCETADGNSRSHFGSSTSQTSGQGKNPLETMGKVHGSLARAGKVKNQTPKVAKAEKKKVLTGRAKKRMTFNRRFVSVVKGGPKRGPNSNQK